MRTPQVGDVIGLNCLGGDAGGQGRNRTADTRIFSPLLYRLSYLALQLSPLDQTDFGESGEAYLSDSG